MWSFLGQRAKSYLEREDVLEASQEYPDHSAGYWDAKGFVRFLCRYPEEQSERIIEAYLIQKGRVKCDPIEDYPQYKTMFEEMDSKLNEEFSGLGLGSCHRIWRKKKAILKEKGISWLSPKDLNPWSKFD